MKVLILNQARMTSTRLPGKVLKTILGKSLLEYQIERLKRVKNAHHLIIATTELITDDPVVELCKRLGVAYYRGSEQNVLSRFYEAAKPFQADAIVRVTSDCPLIDPQVIEKVIHHFLENFPKYFYVSNVIRRTYPRGMDTEVFSFEALEKAFLNARNDEDREHVTPYITDHPEHFPQGSVTYFEDQSEHRWTVDTPEDFLLIEKIISTLYPQNPQFRLEDALDLLKQHPDWKKINAHIEQKK